MKIGIQLKISVYPLGKLFSILIHALDKAGEKGAGALLGKLDSFGETARDLSYRLYTICERKGWAQEALAYNMLVVAWPRIKEQGGKGPRQESLL